MALTSLTFRKLLIGGFILMAGTLLGLNFYLTRFTVQLQTENIHRRLQAEAEILANEAATVTPAALEDWSRQARARSGARVAVIGPRGIVLADSQEASSVSASPAPISPRSGMPSREPLEFQSALTLILTVSIFTWRYHISTRGKRETLCNWMSH